MATTKGRNYSILVGIKLDTSDVQKQLDAIKGREIKVKVSVEGNEELKETAETMGQLPKRSKTIKEETDKTTDSIKDQADEVEKLGLTYQQANAIMSKSVEIIGMMVDSVFSLDDAMTELNFSSLLLKNRRTNIY